MKRYFLITLMIVLALVLANKSFGQNAVKYIFNSNQLDPQVMYTDIGEVKNKGAIKIFTEPVKHIFWTEDIDKDDFPIKEVHLLSDTEAKVIYADSVIDYELIKKGNIIYLHANDTLETARDLFTDNLVYKPMYYSKGKTPLNRQLYYYRPFLVFMVGNNKLIYPMVSYRKKTIGNKNTNDDVIGGTNNKFNKEIIADMVTDIYTDSLVYQENIVIFKKISDN